MPADVERALAQAREAVVEMVRRGRLEEAIGLVLDSLREALAPLVKSVVELRESVAGLRDRMEELTTDIGELREGLAELRDRIGELTANVNELRESVASLERSLREEVELRRRLRGRVDELVGWKTELGVALGLAKWFSKKAPEYEVMEWFRTGADVLIEGRGVLAAVEITRVPHVEDVDQLKNGVGAIKDAWGREPDVLVIWSDSGVVPEEVAEYATKRGVRIVRGHRELKRLLDGVAEVGKARS